MMRASHRAQHPESEQQDEDHHPDNQKDRGNDPADLAGLSLAAAAGVHRTSVHFFEIGRSHEPRGNAERTANDQTENSQYQYQRPAMWFHILSLIEVAFF
jgi:hypothetical protein